MYYSLEVTCTTLITTVYIQMPPDSQSGRKPSPSLKCMFALF